MMVKIQREPYTGKELSGERMYEMCFDFYRDLDGLETLPFQDYFDLVKEIPYASDSDISPNEDAEITARPAYLLSRSMFPSLDCKKKSILIGAWAQAQNPPVPFRFLAVAEYPNLIIHHVFPQLDFGMGWENCDATFSTYKIGMGIPVTRAEVLIP